MLNHNRAFNDVVVGDNGDGVQHEQGSPFPSTCPNAFVAGNAQCARARTYDMLQLRSHLIHRVQHQATTLSVD